MTVPPPWSAPTMAGFLAVPGSVLVHEAKAFALGRIIVGEAELLTIAVDPEAQRQGLGRICLQRFVETCRKRQASRILLEVAETNQAARALYGTEGFVEDGRRKGYYRASGADPIDAILMSMLLEEA
jgi:ribosomal-protein-alanine N-acetyltransferase